jgi:hypothetical protein
MANEGFFSTNEFSSGPNTADGELIGRNADSKVAFYGGVPAVQPQVPAAATGAQIATALASLGLVKIVG